MEKWKSLSCVQLFVTPWTTQFVEFSCPEYWSEDSLHKGILPTHGLNPGLPHCRWILYQLNHKGSPRILDWEAYPFSSGSSQPMNQTRSSALHADSLPTELSGKPLLWKAVTISFNKSVLFWPFLEYNICCSDSLIQNSSSSHFEFGNTISSVQFSSVAQSCPNLCNPMKRSMPGLPVHHQLPEFTQTHVHRVSDAIQPSHPLSSPSPSAPNPSQHQSLFQWVNSSHEVVKVLEFQP